MKGIWIITLLAMIVCSSCSHNKPNQTVPEGITKAQSTTTPDLLDGQEIEVRSPHPLSLADLRINTKAPFS